MSGNNQNGYAESKRLLLGVGDLYFNNIFVGNLKGKVELKFTRKYAYQRAGNNVADQKGEITDEECTLSAEVCDIKLSQLRTAFGIQQAVDKTTAKTFLHRETFKLSGVVAYTPAHTPSPASANLFTLDRKTQFISGTDYKISGGHILRISGAGITTGSYVLAEYQWSNASGNSLRFGGETLPPQSFELDYVHVDSAGHAWQVRIFKAMVNTNFAASFEEVQKGTYTTHNIDFKALVDTTKPEGQNLGEILEEAPAA